MQARDILCRALKIDAPAPDYMLASMAAIPIPNGKPDDKASPFGDPLQDALFDQFRIEVPVMPWPSPPKRLLRISAQLYNSIDQYSKLADALCRLL